ncbi:hypothetical protein ACFVAF_25040 [Streptomyces sp. NPDC057596]|uniref:hypothetical protein n=1 Tax=Streptomyces sp. NPDC057596 TaxID=3346178 RepID=UPI00368605F3
MTEQQSRKQLTPADELRAAAAKLRSLTTDATEGPWHGEDPNTRWGDAYDHQLVGGGKILATFNSDYNGPLNADYVAAMHPGVGVVLAQLLDYGVRSYEASLEAARRVWGDTHDDERRRFTEEQSGLPELLAVARAVLGRTAEG